MMDPGREAIRRALVRKVLGRRVGASVDATAVAEAARRAYDDLAQVLAPVIGDVGVAAMTGRALHLTTREYAWLLAGTPVPADDTPFTQVVDALKRHDDPAVAAEAAAAVFAAIIGLLATFIGDRLAARLVQQAWPDAVSSADTVET